MAYYISVKGCPSIYRFNDLTLWCDSIKSSFRQVHTKKENVCKDFTKGYLHYKMITCQNVLSETQIKNFFIS